MFKRFLKALLYFLVFVVAVGLSVFLVFRLMGFDNTVKVPVISGMSVSDAEKLLNDENLFLEVKAEAYNSDLLPGYVISQDVRAGDKIKKQSSIGVIISKGKSMFVMPDFVGMEVKDVELTLMKSGLSDKSEISISKIIRVHSDAVEKDLVIAQRPLAGGSSESRISLLVSLGPYDMAYKCPLFVNMTLDEARTIAKTLGIKLVETDRGNVVVGQKPGVNAVIKRGDSVEITLGRGGWFWF